MVDIPDDVSRENKDRNLCGYKQINKKGSGSYGLVFEVENNEGDLYAFKYVKDRTDDFFLGIENLIELDILSRIVHPNIIHQIEIITDAECEKLDGIAIILPLADRTLADIKRETTDFKLPFLYKTAEALKFLHDNNILHLDIKDKNVVLQGKNSLLIDFGLSLIVDNIITGEFDSLQRVTIDHRPPELLSGSRIYNAAIDVWSFGIMMLTVLSGLPSVYDVNWDTITDEQLVYHTIQIFSDPNNLDHYLKPVREKYRQLCKNLLSKILVIDPTKRITMKEIVADPLFAVYRETNGGELIEPHIPYDYADDYRNILKLIVHWANEIYPNERAELLFLAIDLYSRLSSFFKNKQSHDRMILGSTCLFMASKMVPINNLIYLDHYVPKINMMVSNITASNILDMEKEIIHLQNGILHINKLYQTAINANQLIQTFKFVIMSYDSTLYAKLDISAWLNIVNDELPIESTKNDKNITINEIHNYYFLKV